MRYQRNVETQFERDRPRVAKTAARDERDANAFGARVFDCVQVAFRNLTLRLRSVPSRSSANRLIAIKTDKVAFELTQIKRGVILCAPLKEQTTWRKKGCED